MFSRENWPSSSIINNNNILVSQLCNRSPQISNFIDLPNNLLGFFISGCFPEKTGHLLPLSTTATSSRRSCAIALPNFQISSICLTTCLGFLFSGCFWENTGHLLSYRQQQQQHHPRLRVSMDCMVTIRKIVDTCVLRFDSGIVLKYRELAQVNLCSIYLVQINLNHSYL